MTTTTSATPVKGTTTIREPHDIVTTDEPDDIITTKEPHGIITTDEPYDIITTDRASITTEFSTMILGNSAERNLAVVIGGTLAGLILLLVAMIAFILIIVMVLYRTKHNKKTITRQRSVPNNITHSASVYSVGFIHMHV